jgi:hypothetical protein
MIREISLLLYKETIYLEPYMLLRNFDVYHNTKTIFNRNHSCSYISLVKSTYYIDYLNMFEFSWTCY